MKNFILGIAVLVALSAFTTAGPISGKVIKQFKENHPTASNVKWYQGKDYYQVSFFQNDIRSIMYFNNKNQMYRTLRYYSGDQLPPFITFKLNERYKNKDIKGVTELTNTVEGVVYEIVLEDSHNTFIVQSDNYGNLHTTKRLKKSE